MQKKITWIAVHIGVFLLLVGLLWMLLTGTAAIPNEMLYDHFTESALTYRQVDPYQFRESGRLREITDNYADSILLNVAWQMGTGDSPAADALDTAYYNGEGYGKNVGLYLAVTEGAEPNTDYTRYWHGSAMMVRFFHLFTNVTGMLWIGFALTLMGILVTIAMLCRRGHYDLAVLLAVSLSAVHFWHIRVSLEYQTVFLVTFILCPLYLLAERKGKGWLSLLSVTGGVLVAFFDFLTTETMTILLPLLLVAAVRAREERLGGLRDGMRWTLPCLTVWGMAYAGTFLAKWTLATLATGKNAFRLAADSVAERVGLYGGLNETLPEGILPTVTANLTVLAGGTDRVQPWRAVFAVIITAAVLGSLWYLFRREDKKADSGVWLFWILGALVLVRFWVLNNHSYLHEFFTYRALCSTLFAALAAWRMGVVLPWEQKPKEGKGKKRK